MKKNGENAENLVVYRKKNGAQHLRLVEEIFIAILFTCSLLEENNQTAKAKQKKESKNSIEVSQT